MSVQNTKHFPAASSANGELSTIELASSPNPIGIGTLAEYEDSNSFGRPRAPARVQALSDLAAKTTIAIIRAPVTNAVAIALRGTPSRAAPTKAHDENGRYRSTAV